MEHDREELRRRWDATNDATNDDIDSTVDDGESHATTGGAAAAGAVTGGVIGLAGGPIGAAVGAVGGAIVGAAAERMMHNDDDAERANMGLDDDRDSNPLIEDRDRLATTDTTAAQTTDQDRMQLREEELHARKTTTETGEVRLGKEVVTEQRTVEVPVTREEVYIERQAVDRHPSDKPISETEHASIDVPVREERVTVEKQPVVYEEVGVGKRQVEETRDVNATVRREELRVEQEGGVTLRGGDDSYRQYVSEWRTRPGYSGRTWTDVEGEFERDWSTRNPETPWSTARERVRGAWENATD